MRQIANTVAGRHLTSAPRHFGLSATDKISNFYEFNVEEGGPIVKDKLWFFGAFRNAPATKRSLTSFNMPRAGSNVPAAFQACLATPGSCDQGVSDEKMDNPVVRFTWQMSPRNKFAAYMDRAMRLRGHAMGRPHRSGDRLGGVAHADLRDRLGEVDVHRVVEAAGRNRLLVQPRAVRQRLPGRPQPDVGHGRVVRRREQERQQHRPAVERVERAARQLPRQVQR